MPTIMNMRITSPEQISRDGLELADGQDWLIKNCIIDLSACPLDEIDEAVAIVGGSSATFQNCVIKGAGKLFLCGSGDTDKAGVERGKVVRLHSCILEDFGRRGPEVQAGMQVFMRDCLIRNWCEPSRFSVRSFGAWAHSGGKIWAKDCIFTQPSFWRGIGLFLRDFAGHVGQAVNDSGLWALFSPRTYLPGVCRGLTAGPGGHVEAEHCYAGRWWVRIENHSRPMCREDALLKAMSLKSMQEQLEATL